MLKGLPFYSSTYALIKNGVVENLIVADGVHTAMQISQAHNCDEAVCIEQYTVGIGDQYIDGVFYHEGNEVERQLTLEEENAKLKEQLASVDDALLALMLQGGN